MVKVNDEEIAEFHVKSREASSEPVDVTSDMEGWEKFGEAKKSEGGGEE